MQQKSYAHIMFYYQRLNKSFICLIFLFFYAENVNAQQFNNWYFPAFSGITFNTNPPSFLPNYPSNRGGCAIISDINSRVLFYTDGVEVWNKNNQKMLNGVGLLGNFSASNNVLIVPFVNQNKYYIFTADGIFFQSGASGYNYSIVDMDLNNGLGDVSQKNIFLNGPSSEKIFAAPHANGTDVWLVTKNQNNVFFSYKITCNGIITTPVISNAGFDYNIATNPNFGEIKISTDNSFIAMSSFYGSFFQLFKFDNSTGILGSALKIDVPNIFPFGVEFSPDSRKLYLSTSTSSSANRMNLFQANLNQYDSLSIANSLIEVGHKENVLQGTLQLGPDRKIYHIGSIDSSLNIIYSPNTIGVGCNYQNNQIFLQNNVAGRLPYAPTFLFTNQNVQIPTYTIAPDCRTVTLTGKTYIKGNNLTFKWKFGNGDSTVQVIPSGGDTTFTSVIHTYPLGIDTFNVQLFVTSDTVCGQGGAGKKVILTPLPKPTAKFGYNTICNQLQVSFTDSSLLNSSQLLSYQWQFFSKSNVLLGSSTQQNPSFTYPTYDTVKARLIVKSNIACVKPDTLTKIIVLKAKPVASFSYNSNCGSPVVAFTNASTVAADTLQTFYWNFGNGTTSNLKNPTASYSSFGSYTIKLVSTSSQGCNSDTAIQTIILKAKPIANFIYNNNGCINQAFILTDSSYAATLQQYYWLLPNGSSYTSSSINPSFAQAGSYAIQYAVTSNQGCTSDTISKTILVEGNPIAAIAPASGGCVGKAINFTSQSSIAVGSIKTYQWYFTPTDSSLASNASFAFGNAGNYTISHSVVSNNGCKSNIATQPISIQSNPQSSFTYTPICVGKLITFTNQSSNIFGAITNSQWWVNNNLQSNNANGFTYTFAQAGNYLVQLQSSTANGCSNTYSQTLVVNLATAFAGNDTTVREGEPFALQGNGGSSYLWQPSIGLDNNTNQQPIGKLNSSQQYVLKITTADGCIGFDTVMITVLRNLKIPNAFSPNGDGVNDVWQIEQLKDYPNAELQLYNRYGALMYTAKANTANGWNGKMNNKAVPVGTYYYIITLNNKLSSKPYSGWVVVVR